MGVITWEGLWGLQGRLGASGELLASLPAHNGAAQLEPDFSRSLELGSRLSWKRPSPPGPAPSSQWPLLLLLLQFLSQPV